MPRRLLQRARLRCLHWHLAAASWGSGAADGARRLGCILPTMLIAPLAAGLLCARLGRITHAPLRVWRTPGLWPQGLLPGGVAIAGPPLHAAWHLAGAPAAPIFLFFGSRCSSFHPVTFLQLRPALLTLCNFTPACCIPPTHAPAITLPCTCTRVLPLPLYACTLSHSFRTNPLPSPYLLSSTL